MASSDSDSFECRVGSAPGHQQRTLADGKLRGYQPGTIPERQKLRKKRRFNGVCVLEGPRTEAGSEVPANEADGGGPAGVDGAMRGARSSRVGARRAVDSSEAIELSVDFAEDYFQSQGCAKVKRSAVTRAAECVPVCPVPQKPKAEQFSLWLERLQLGFSILLHGVGSKRNLLEEFAGVSIKPWGVSIVKIYGFNARFSLLECLRGTLRDLFDAPICGTSVDAVGATLRSAMRTCARPLCFIVHNLDVLPEGHQRVIAKLAATPGIHLVASVDSIWAPNAWESNMLKDFNFCRQEAHTYENYVVEAAARYPSGLPQWTGLGAGRRQAPKASLTLVLRSLTSNHRELVQAIAEHQLEGGKKTGISKGVLLKMTTERMIAHTAPKLKALLNELRDHEVVLQRGTSDGELFYLPYDEKTLQRLVDDEPFSDSEDEDCEGEAEKVEDVLGECAGNVA